MRRIVALGAGMVAEVTLTLPIGSITETVIVSDGDSGHVREFQRPCGPEA